MEPKHPAVHVFATATATTSTSTPGPLPQGWTENKSVNGRYYYTDRHGKSQWHFPTVNETPQIPPQPISLLDSTTTTPPRNGVRNSPVKVRRASLVEHIITRAISRRICIIRSPPGTGKTSLLDLLEETLEKDGRNSLKRLTMIERTDETQGTTFSPLENLRQELEVTRGLPSGYSELDPKKNTWILIDDAQLIFDDRGFWQAAVKYLENFTARKVFVVIAATYDLISQGTTPITFKEYPHVQDVMFTTEESEQIYDGYMKLPGYTFASGWIAVKDKILKLANGHVGVLTAGLLELSEAHSAYQKRPTEGDALDGLSGSRFLGLLSRCFPSQLLAPLQINEIIEVICASPRPPTRSIDTSDSSNARAQLVRAGILKVDGTFTCPLAQQRYFSCFYNRPVQKPVNLAAFIILAISSMSALRLQQSTRGRSFPKEAVFQQLLNEAMTKHLPPTVDVCPEFNTFAKDPETQDSVTGELDFFIVDQDGNFKWALELLVEGKKIMEHVSRFDESNGKYRKVGYDDYLVVDFTKVNKKGRATNIARIEKRCTVFFHNDYTRAEYVVGDQAVESLELNH